KWTHLAADLENSLPSKGLSIEQEQFLQKISSQMSFLMVGTIEPRKGYLQSLEAFSLLWSQEIDINLIIVGKEGWRTLSNEIRRDIPQTVCNLNFHPEAGKHLFWLPEISDEFLQRLYQ